MTSSKKQFFILMHCKDRVPTGPIAIDGWELSFKDLGTLKIELKKSEHRKWVEEFYLKNLQRTINQKTDLWVYKGNSRRQFYDLNSFSTDQEIDGYRRYDLSAKYIHGAGLAVNVEVKTAFFTKFPVEYYFLKGREERFAELTSRFQDMEYVKYKGTLLFRGPNYFTKCYFVKFCSGMTLSTTPAITISDKKRYANLYEYYQKEYPSYAVDPNDTVALVSFPFDGATGEKYVPAKNVFLRVMNADIDGDLSNEDKIAPEDRIRMIASVWSKVGDKPFGPNLAGIMPGLYTPGENTGRVNLPALKFGSGRKKMPPTSNDRSDYKNHYWQVLENLKKHGCFFVPKVIDRKLHFAFSEKCEDEARSQFVNDLSAAIGQVTKCEIEPIVNSQETHFAACQDLLNNHSPGIVAFVFDDNDPATYYNISYELEKWKIQHITSRELIRKFRSLQSGLKGKKPGDPKSKGEKSWDSFINLIAFGIVQELGCIPYVFESKLNYDMHVHIDVSEKFQFFGIGMMLYEPSMQSPILDPIIRTKSKRNDIIESPKLEKYLKELLIRNSSIILEKKIKKALVTRDGQEFGTEHESFVKVVNELRGKELPANFSFDFVEYHKDTSNEIRIWERVSQNQAVNVPEGTFVQLDSRTALLATTGSGTLHQGTARPIYLHSKYGSVEMEKIIHDIFLTSQLNFNSPSVAQRLTLLAKRIDDLLRQKKAQTVEQLK